MNKKDIEKEIETLKEKLSLLEKELKEDLTIADIKVGEQFVYGGRKYTKLNEENFCINDDCDGSFMRCVFDPISNNYKTSLVRYYINSDRFIEKLGIELDDLAVNSEFGDYIVLLSKEEYEKYRDLIRGYDCWWMTRSTSSSSSSYFCSIYNSGGISSSYVFSSYAVRAGFNLKPETKVKMGWE